MFLFLIFHNADDAYCPCFFSFAGWRMWFFLPLLAELIVRFRV